MATAKRKSRQQAIKSPGRGDSYQKGMGHAARLAARGHIGQVMSLIHREKDTMKRLGPNPPTHRTGEHRACQQRLYAYLTVLYNHRKGNPLQQVQSFSLFVEEHFRR